MADKTHNAKNYDDHIKKLNVDIKDLKRSRNYYQKAYHQSSEQLGSLCAIIGCLLVFLGISVLVIIGLSVFMPIGFTWNSHHHHTLHLHNGNETKQINDIDICSSLSIDYEAGNSTYKNDMVITIDGYIDNIYVKSMQCRSACTFYLALDPDVFEDDHVYDYIISANHEAYVTYETHNPCTDWGIGIEIALFIIVVLIAICCTSTVTVIIVVAVLWRNKLKVFGMAPITDQDPDESYEEA